MKMTKKRLSAVTAFVLALSVLAAGCEKTNDDGKD